MTQNSAQLIREGYRRARQAASTYFPKTVTITVGEVGIRGTVMDYLCSTPDCWHYSTGEGRAYCGYHGT